MTISHTFLKTLTALAIALAIMLPPLSYAQTNNNAMPTKPSIEFLDKTYHLAETSDPASSYSKYSGAIYVLDGETLSDYTHALIMDQELDAGPIAGSVMYFLEITQPEVIDTGDNIINRIENLNIGESLLLFLFNQRNEGREIITDSNILKNLEFIEKPDAGDIFLVSVFREHDKKRDQVIWTWLAYRYSLVQTADGKQGVRRFGYSRLHYGDEGIADFLQAINVTNPHSQAINAVISAQVP